MSRWQLVQELFEETLALSASERARVLRERSGGDPALAREVEALVAADATPLAALEGTAAELFAALKDDPPAEDLCGESFGPYRVEEHLSSGGMGHVYRAVRTSAGTTRRVAMKVLRPGLDTDAFLQRFQLERETLAALEHEHIVAFLDAGALPDGRPYLVMEYVEGTPLTEWSKAASRAGRLRLFLEVLAAVQYAHEQRVVHRDLKPSNVLVTAQGRPKLLDFGVATIMAPVPDEAGGRPPLTPVYASPEQLRGEPATVASDVYSLGRLLHELLTGELPGSPSRGARVALGGDLAAIVRKATALDPEQRYRSAELMAEDLRRHLAGAPVAARPGTWLYVGSLFVGRNRWRLAFAAAVFLALVAGWIGSDLDRRRAEREASLGWGAHGQAKVVARVFEGWIAAAAAANPELGAEAVAHLERALDEDLGDLPEAETMVRLALARLCLERGELERASAHAERAWELAQTTRGVSERERRRAAELRGSIPESR